MAEWSKARTAERRGPGSNLGEGWEIFPNDGDWEESSGGIQGV